MKFLLLAAAAGLLSFTAQSQNPASYAQLMEQAGPAFHARQFCEATPLFERAFASDSTQASPFELFAAATSAAQCPTKEPLAWRWLGQLSRRRPLPMQPRDLDNILADSSLASLKAD